MSSNNNLSFPSINESSSSRPNSATKKLPPLQRSPSDSPNCIGDSSSCIMALPTAKRHLLSPLLAGTSRSPSRQDLESCPLEKNNSFTYVHQISELKKLRPLSPTDSVSSFSSRGSRSLLKKCLLSPKSSFSSTDENDLFTMAISTVTDKASSLSSAHLGTQSVPLPAIASKPLERTLSDLSVESDITAVYDMSEQHDDQLVVEDL